MVSAIGLAHMPAPTSAATPTSILDIQGASGALYRFYGVEEPRHLPSSGGNFVCVRQEGREVCMVASGSASDLRQASAFWETAITEHFADRLLVRLNISRSVREREHADLIGRHHPAMVMGDLEAGD